MCLFFERPNFHKIQLFGMSAISVCLVRGMHVLQLLFWNWCWEEELIVTGIIMCNVSLTGQCKCYFRVSKFQNFINAL